jgi:hypothetical protein
MANDTHLSPDFVRRSRFEAKSQQQKQQNVDTAFWISAYIQVVLVSNRRVLLPYIQSLRTKKSLLISIATFRKSVVYPDPK